jgi:hypothetical protein
MDRKSKDEILIRDYLLGELPLAEQAQLEQRLMTEDDCFQVAAAVEEELVDQYLYGNLSKDEEEKFSRRFLATSEGAEQLRLAANLKRYALRHQAQKRARSSPGDADTLWRRGFPWSRLQSSASRYALAATVILLAAILLGLGWRVWRLQSQVEQLRAGQGASTSLEREFQDQLADQQTRNDDLARALQQAQEERARLEQEVLRLNGSGNDRPQPLIATLTLTPGGIRGGGQSNLLAIKPSTSQVRLHLLVREPAYEVYQAFLQTDNGKPVWTSESLKPQIAGGRIHLRISLPAQFLSGGDYRLHLQGRTGQGNDEEAGNYYFRVAKD